MGKLHKGSLLALSVLFCLLLCGCQGLGGKSPNQRSVAQVMALDLVPGSEPIRLTLRVLDEEGSPEGPASFRTVQAQGKTITGALGEAGRQLGKEIFLRDIRLVLLGEGLCRRGIDSFQNFMSQSYQIRPRVSVAAVRQEAAPLLEADDSGEAPADSLVPLLEWNNRPGNPAVTVMEAERLRSAGEGDCFLPLASLDGEGKGEVSGAAVFRGGRLARLLDVREAEQLRLLAADPRQSVVVVSLPGGGSASFRLTGRKGRLHGSSVQNIPQFTSKFTFEFQLLEFDGNSEDSSNLEELERALEEKVKGEMEECIRKVVFDSGADVMGMAVSQRRDNAEWWNRNRDWRKEREGETLFEKSVFYLDIKCRITQTDVSIPLIGT